MVYFKILTKALKNSASDFLNLNILINYFEYNLSTLLSEALDSGNSINIELSDSGIMIKISCFSDLADKITRVIINEIFKFTPDNIIFEEIIEMTVKNLNSNKNSKPVMKNKMYFDKLVKYNIVLYTEMLDIIQKEKESSGGRVSSSFFQKFLNTYENFKNDAIVNVFFWGNIEREEIDKIVNLLKQFTPKIRIANEESVLHDPKYIQNSIHLHKRFDSPITFQVINDAQNEMNHAVTHYYQIGIRDIKNALYMTALDKCLGQVFYYNLRTVQQLGYIVHAGNIQYNSIMVKKYLIFSTSEYLCKVLKNSH
jgi:secreted Zn-dependent insulinase-like peptidase